MPTERNRDILKEWMALSREMLSSLYPEADSATLVVPLGDGIPHAVLPFTLLQDSQGLQVPKPISLPLSEC